MHITPCDRGLQVLKWPITFFKSKKNTYNLRNFHIFKCQDPKTKKSENEKIDTHTHTLCLATSHILNI